MISAARQALGVALVVWACAVPCRAADQDDAQRPGHGQESIATLRALYEDAAYREALALADRLRGQATAPAEETALVERYRALSAFALKQPDVAQAALEAMVRLDPLLQAIESDLPPRVRTAIEDARRRLLPGLARDAYMDGRRAHEARQHAAALGAFDKAVAIVDAAAALGVGDAELADLRVLAAGFRDLVASTAARTPAASAPPTAPSRATSAGGATGETPGPRGTAGAGGTPAGTPPRITAPTVMRQDLPPWPASLRHLVGTTPAGLLEVTIGASGLVESARMVRALHPAYDRLAVEAARQWRYTPATRDGVPVAYVKLVRIDVAMPR